MNGQKIYKEVCEKIGWNKSFRQNTWEASIKVKIDEFEFRCEIRWPWAHPKGNYEKTED